MDSKFLFVLSVSLLVLSAGCVQQPSAKNALLGDNFALNYGETVLIQSESIQINFKDVLSDSRCPVDVQCIAAGEALISVNVKKNGIDLGDFNLTALRQDTAKKFFDGYSLRLVSLSPQPRLAVQIGKNDYSAEFVVLKEEGVNEMANVVIVEQGDLIKAEYTGKFPDSGEVFDSSEGRAPLEFTAGAGQMIAGFDEAVIGMKLNEEKTVVIPPEKAYGAADAEGERLEVPVTDIGGGDDMNIGTVVYSQTGSMGTVIALNDGIATIEFRHPLAGKTLEFWIKIVAIEKK